MHPRLGGDPVTVAKSARRSPPTADLDLAVDPASKLRPGPGLSAEDVAAHQIARIHGAMVGLVAERGYAAVKVRDVVAAAGVSTRAFYERFKSKEECFLRTYEAIVQPASRRILAAQANELAFRERPSRVFDELARQLEAAPDAARLALVEAYVAGPECLESAWRVERTAEAVLAEGLARSPGGVALPPLVAEGIVAGAMRVARTRLLAGRVGELAGLSEEMTEWCVAYADPAVADLAALDAQSVWHNTALEPLAMSAGGADGAVWPSAGDRSLILSAVAKLAVAEGYTKLTVPRICSAAGISRKKFDTFFEGAEGCYLAALEQHAAEALAQAARAQAAARSWPGGVYRAIAALCEHVAGDAFLAGACLGDDFKAGSSGSRARQRLIAAVAEQLTSVAPRESRPSDLAAEAAAGAVWSVFHHHLVRDWAMRREISATLAYLALAPAIGAQAAVAAIAAEQTG